MASVILAKLLGQAILKPLNQLREITTEFSSGNRQVRAEKFANDEMGDNEVVIGEQNTTTVKILDDDVSYIEFEQVSYG